MGHQKNKNHWQIELMAQMIFYVDPNSNSKNLMRRDKAMMNYIISSRRALYEINKTGTITV